MSSSDVDTIQHIKLTLLYAIYESRLENKSWEFSSQGKVFFSISLIFYACEMMDVY